MKKNIVVKTEKNIEMMADYLGVNMDRTSIINDNKEAGLYVNELSYAVGVNARGQKNPRTEGTPESVAAAYEKNVSRANEIAKSKVNFNSPQATVWNAKVLKEVREFINDLIEYNKTEVNLKINLRLMEQFLNDYFPEIKEDDYYVADGNTICQLIEDIHEKVESGDLSSDAMKKIAKYYDKEKLKVILYTENVFESPLPETDAKYGLEYGCKCIQLINLLAMYNHKSWTAYNYEKFYLNFIRLICLFVHKEFKAIPNYANKSMFELVNAMICLFLPDVKKLDVTPDDLSRTCLLVIKAVTNQTAKACRKNKEDVAKDRQISNAFFGQKGYNSILNTITSSYLTLSNFSVGMGHVQEWCNSVVRLQAQTRLMEEYNVPSNRDRTFGVKVVFENKDILEKKENICSKIIKGIHPDKICELYLDYEKAIKDALIIYYKNDTPIRPLDNANTEELLTLADDLYEKDIEKAKILYNRFSVLLGGAE